MKQFFNQLKYDLPFVKKSLNLLIFNSYFFFNFFQTVFNKEYLVRPTGQLGGKDRTKSTSSETASPSASPSDTPTVPEFAYSEAILQSVGIPLREVIQQVRFFFKNIHIP